MEIKLDDMCNSEYISHVLRKTNFNFAAAVDLKKHLKQIKIPIARADHF